MGVVIALAAVGLYFAFFGMAALFHFGLLSHLWPHYQNSDGAYAACASSFSSCPLVLRFSGGALITLFRSFRNLRYSRLFLMPRFSSSSTVDQHAATFAAAETCLLRMYSNPARVMAPPSAFANNSGTGTDPRTVSHARRSFTKVRRTNPGSSLSPSDSFGRSS